MGVKLRYIYAISIITDNLTCRVIEITVITIEDDCIILMGCQLNRSCYRDKAIVYIIIRLYSSPTMLSIIY